MTLHKYIYNKVYWFYEVKDVNIFDDYGHTPLFHTFI